MPESLFLNAKLLINRNCYFDLTGKITIGSNVGVGHGVTFITSIHEIGDQERRVGYINKQKLKAKDITIEDGVWICANVTIQLGVTIGKGAVVMTGSVVAKDVAPNTLVGGIPAQFVKELPLE